MVQRALNRWVDSRVTVPVTSVYDQRTRDRMTAFQLSENVKPADGSLEQATLDKLWPFFDRYGRMRYRTFRLPKPPLVEPKQGFDSLDESLWEPYTIAIRSIGGYDLGTYNPASRLPGGGLSDHAVYPAFAFDIGFRPWTGWWNPLARRGFWKLAKHPAIEYVILGGKIHSKERGLHPYTAGGHLNHVHASGLR